MRGVNAPELRTQVDMLLFEAFPRELCYFLSVHHLTHLPGLAHAHLSLSLPYLASVSTQPIMFRTVASLDAVVAKLVHFIDSSELQVEEKARIKDIIESAALPFLKLQVLPRGKAAVKPLSSLAPMLAEWSDASKILISALPTEQLFPVVDLWRVGFLNTTVGTWVSEAHATTPGAASSTISELLNKAQFKPLPRTFVLTLLKCFCNAFGAPALSQRILSPGSLRDKLTDLAISQLLEEDSLVRTTAASLVFNISSGIRAQRADTGNNCFSLQNYPGVDAEWEMEVVSAVIEGIRREEAEEIRKFSVSSKNHSVEATQSIGWSQVSDFSFGCPRRMKTSCHSYWRYSRSGNYWRRKQPRWRRRLTLFS